MQSVVKILLLAAVLSAGVTGDIFSDIGGTLSDAVDTVGNTATNVANSVTSATGTATDAVQNAVSTSTNAVQNAAQTVSDTATRTIDTSEHWISNTAGTASNAVVNFTQDQWNAATGVADQVGSSISSVTGSAVSVGRQAAGTVGNTAASVTGNGAPAPQGIDATDPNAILVSLTGAGGFPPVAIGILQGLAADRAAAVADATAAVIVNATGNDTTEIGVAQAWATAIGIAQNNTEQVHVNATQVAEAFMASLQNAIVPCATQLQPTIQPPAQLGSPEYSQAVANGCCSIISRALTTEAMVSDLIGVDAEFYAALQQSDAFGRAPQLNLGKCLTDQTEVS